MVKKGRKWKINFYICPDYSELKYKKMINLIGVYECKVDTNGRLMFSSALKKQLLSVINDGFVIKRSVYRKCLELYPMGIWNKEIENVNKLNRFIEENNDFIRLFMVGVKIVELDGSGRLLIPKDLIKFVGIKKDIVLASAIDRIEIWDKEEYESEIQKRTPDFPDLAKKVMGRKDNLENKNAIP